MLFHTLKKQRGGGMPELQLDIHVSLAASETYFMNHHRQPKFSKSRALYCRPTALHNHNGYSLAAAKTAFKTSPVAENTSQLKTPRSFDSISDSLAWSALFFICSSCGFHSQGTWRDHIAHWIPYTYIYHLRSLLATCRSCKNIKRKLIAEHISSER